LLEDAAHYAACLLGHILERRSSRVSVQTAHGHAEEGATGEELTIRLAEPGTLLIGMSVF